ncbi:PhzF family phenazine biosynthesis protein [Lacinutrix sp. MedPE-SW]|uniref:PhzF family phenazine biosynthesis protein n=1 Tax=Lacinutrix sp. MedPE-SW TaxID=1860087 RepID=UPI0009158CD5|nr:PhzF family phenazine biosynthesis protein [Lacinutrix sp. MedPE-SW]OIQ23936.1 MAG: isomerase [Lacinutrix sp. MedPE-SW]
MKLELYQIDAFTNTIFGGNPACVVPLDYWLPDKTLFNITKENAVAETAFFVKTDNIFHLRWFTPEIEMDLCGHATLATAHCIKTILKYPENKITFKTLSGELTVLINNDTYALNLPSRMPVKATLPSIIKDAINIQPKAIYKSRDYVLVYDSQKAIENIKVNRAVFDKINLDPGGVIVTAKGNTCDFVSRFFTPQASILEDPVTGSAHCSLVPFWAKYLQKNSLEAIQLSKRGGHLSCINKENRVIISGNAKTYSCGYLWTE